MPRAIPAPTDIQQTLKTLQEVIAMEAISLEKGIMIAYELGFNVGVKEALVEQLKNVLKESDPKENPS